MTHHTSEHAARESTDRIIDLARDSQESMAQAARTWTQTLERMLPDFSRLSAGEFPAEARQAVDATFDLAEELVRTQRRFAHDMLSAFAPLLDTARGRQGEAARDPGRDPTASPRPDYESMTVEELQELASARDIEGRSSMNKAQLVAALQKAG
ncbi:MAG: Rho termination factor N-terminal domain-containing protein [Actinomycetota bacterium]|nr:Rho termination factor N-terminal domain-containing protein [Actinomycetota bacterium]